MRTAYLIQSHTGVRQIARLVRTLRALDPEAWLHVSHDTRGAAGIEDLTDLGVHITRDPGGRGGYEPIDRWVRATRELKADGGADFVVLLSGQDYPIRPLRQMHDELTASGDGFLESFPVFNSQASHWSIREGTTRYLFRWRTGARLSPHASERLHWLHTLNYAQPFFRANVAYGHLRYAVRGGHVPDGYQCRGGSMFISLSWRAAAHVLQVVESRPDVVRWGKTVLVPDESFFQTILSARPEFTFSASPHRYFKFTESRFGHPKTLTVEDVPEALISGSYFARKFDTTTDPTVLDVVDAALGIST